MRKFNVKVVAFLLLGSMACSSCIGSFSLFNKYAEWQRTMTGNKFVNAIVGFILMPIAGSLTMAADWLVLNTIEFWTGDNPVASNVGKTQNILGSDGLLYAVTTLKNGYEIKAPNGQTSYFRYDKKTNIWSLEQNGTTQQLFRYNEDGTLTTLTDDKQITVTPDEAGLYQVRMAVNGGNFFAMR
jgi:hypothetical protein